MPISEAFAERLFPLLPDIVRHFGTPFHIFDERGITETGVELRHTFRGFPGFQEFFAVKATPTPAILKIMHKLGFGLDCSSPSELTLAHLNGFSGIDIMLTSNDTSNELFKLAPLDGGCILNLDDISMIERIEEFPKLICFRYNPGERRLGSQFIGNPVEAKFGVRHGKIVEAYKRAMVAGANQFGLHTMIISNQLDYRYMLDTVSMLIEVVEMVSQALDVRFEFIDIGGGIGIPYRPDEKPFDMQSFARESQKILQAFMNKYRYVPRLFMECGRYMTGSHGVFVARVINRMSKYREFVGIDASTMSANPRPAIYESAYHHITVLDKNGIPKTGNEEVVDVVGPLCENNDKFAKDRLLPRVEIGDLVIQHDTGAHCAAMGGNYNGWLRPQQLMLTAEGSVELIKRAETMDDLFTTNNFKPKVLKRN